QNPFLGRPSWREVEALPFPDRMMRLSEPEFRARLIPETVQDETLSRRITKWERIFPLGDPPDYEPPAETSIAAMAARQGRKPAEVAYDLLLEDGGRAVLSRPPIHYPSRPLP